MDNSLERKFTLGMKLKRVSWGKYQAFTIVELLVVIAIILILVALLMPTLSRIRESAKATKCMSNMRQISISIFTYASDYDGMAPFDKECLRPPRNWYFVKWSRDPADGSKYQSTYPKNKWFAEYLPGGEVGKMNPIAYCPKGGKFGETGPNYPYNGGYLSNCSYGPNHDLIDPKWFFENFGEDDRRHVPLSQVFQPSKVCLLVETTRDYVWPKENITTGRHFANKRIVNLEEPTVAGKTVYQDHGKMHVVYVDQHIRYKKIPDELPVYSSQFWNHSNTHKPDPYE